MVNYLNNFYNFCSLSHHIYWVKVLAETRDAEHCNELQNALESRYKHVRFAKKDTIHDF